MDKQLRKYIIEEQNDSIERYKFYHIVSALAVETFAPNVGKIITKRECNKLLEKLLVHFPDAGLYFKSEKWGREAQYNRNSHWGAKNECRQHVSIESLTSDKIYTPELHEKNIEKATYTKTHLENAIAKAESLHDIIDLHIKHENERDELAKRQNKESEIFIAQTKCVDTDISYLLKQAEERIRNEERDEYYKKQQAEFEQNQKSS